MGLVSKINTVGDSGWIVDEEEFNLLDDSRLVSPFKRRRIASENLWLNSCSGMVSKKTINRNDEAFVKVAAVAPEYENFWDDMVQFVDADHSGGIGIEDEFDFASDLKLTRQCKRRSIASEDLWLNSFSNEGSRKAVKNSNENNEALVEAVTVDSDYEEFLNNMVQCFDVFNNDDNDKWCVANVNDDDEDHVSEVLDAQYMMFLDNLEEDGKSYVLKYTLSNGTSVVVKYEEENDLVTGLGMGNLETMKDCHNIENIQTEQNLRSQSEREKIESPRRTLRSNLGKKMNESSRKVLRSILVTKKTKSSKTVLRNSSRWRKTEQGRKTLKSGSTREDNESLSLKEAVNREKTESLGTLRSDPCGENCKSPSILYDAVKREKTERLGTLSNPRGENNKSSSIMNDVVKREKTECLEILRSNPQGENSKSPTILNDPVKREKTECNRTLSNGSRRESMGTERKLRGAHSIDKKSPVVEKNVQMETKSPVSCPENGCSIKRHSLEGIHLAKQRFNHGIKSEFDESYQIRLNFVKKDDGCLVHAPEGGKKMVHFGDDESDSEVVVLDGPSFTGDDTPFISARSRAHVDEDCEGCTENDKSQFRDGLLEILQKPYDFTEYARLQIDSRPYLHMQDDFAEVIRQARRDRRKILNLFRGFFYWLQYLHSEGAFMPWLDSQSLSILPPDDY